MLSADRSRARTDSEFPELVPPASKSGNRFPAMSDAR